MKKVRLGMVVLLLLLCPKKALAQAQEIQQLVLNIEKLTQFKAILSDMKKGYEILSGGYKTVKEITEGNFDLHKTFLDALLQVSPVVKNYKRVGDIVSYQILLVKESKRAMNRLVKSGHFTQGEITYFEKVYSNLLEQSLSKLDELLMVVTANKLRMSDDERLAAIDELYLEMQDKILFLRNFNTSSTVLALQRAKEKNDMQAMTGFYQLKSE
jgi:hypothetical protein